MKKGLIFLLVFTMVITGFAVFGNQESIVICSSAEDFRNDALQQQLNERFPNKNIIVMYMSTGKAAAKVYAEGEKTDVDIMLGLETGYMNKISDSLADISGISDIPYTDTLTPADNKNKWVTWEKQAGAIIVNKQILEKYNLPMPKTYEDLLDPIYKGHVAMPNPRSSGTGYFFYKSWVNEWGDEAALDECILALERAAVRLETLGCTLHYHNHHFEFLKIGGETVLDRIARMAPHVQFTLDTYWVQYGGASVLSVIEKLKGRIECVHLKDYAIYKKEEKKYEPGFAPVGSGTIDFPTVVAAMKAAGSTCFFVEQDDAAKQPDPLVPVRESITYILNNL